MESCSLRMVLNEESSCRLSNSLAKIKSALRKRTQPVRSIIINLIVSRAKLKERLPLPFRSGVTGDKGSEFGCTFCH